LGLRKYRCDAIMWMALRTHQCLIWKDGLLKRAIESAALAGH